MSASAFADLEITKSWDDGLAGASANGRSVPTVTLSGEASYEKLLNIFYPVGSVYESVDDSFDPNVAWGGTWEKIESGRFLQAAGDNEAGSAVSAGLPNIKGSIQLGGHTGSTALLINEDTAYRAGAFNVRPTCSGYPNEKWANGTNALSNWADTMHFDASKSNTIYGNSTTVQPAAIKVNMWKRVS